MLFKEMLALHEQDKHVLLAGDWHGNTGWATQKVSQAPTLDASLILHLGDFGIWDGRQGKKYLLMLDKACEKNNVDIVVTLGNHENWARLGQLWANPKRKDEEGNPAPFLMTDTKHIWILPRPYRFTLNRVSFLSLGGAASVDFDYRTPGRDWWIDEHITDEHVKKSLEGGHADIMLAHETVDVEYAVDKVKLMLATNPMGFSLEGLSYSAVSRKKITKAFEGVKPRLFAHGHMHLTGKNELYWEDGSETTVLSLSEEYTNGNLAIIDLNTFPESLKIL